MSLTCVPCKLLEHVVCSNIMSDLDEHKLSSDRQHAFRKSHSCETQLATAIDDWETSLTIKARLIHLSWILKKLLTLLRMNSLKENCSVMELVGRQWIDAFICYGQQRVVINSVKSDRAPIVSGVPQGTVIVPLLFSLHIYK